MKPFDLVPHLTPLVAGKVEPCADNEAFKHISEAIIGCDNIDSSRVTVC